MKYTLIKPENNCGMCGYIWQTLRGIYQNPDKQYYIDFDNCIYKTNDENVWEYCFEQPHTTVKPDSVNIEKTVGILFDQESEFIHEHIIPQTEEAVQKRRLEFSNIIKQYFKLKPHIQERIDTFIEENFKDKRVLGVHFRGTDHPNKKSMNDYLQVVKDTLVDYDKLFICSDEHERFKLASVVFSRKAVYLDSLRSESAAPLHSHPDDMNYHWRSDYAYQRKIVEDVVTEAYLMSKTDMLICCPGSNVNYLARAINPNLKSITL